jgi:RNA polymerase-interacting CarD/CdnL/TRCF family regulator
MNYHITKNTMDIKVKSKVFYPSHGAGWVKREKEIEFNGERKKYFEFELINNPLTISTPIENIEMLGIRPVRDGKDIRETIKALKNKPTKKPDTKDFNNLMSILQELESRATIEGDIEIIQICNHIIKSREKEGRLIPVTIEKQLSQAISDITGELAVSEDTSLEKAQSSFARITGIKVPEE